MITPLSLRYNDSDPSMASEDSFLSRLVAAAIRRPVRVVRDSQQRVDLQFTSVQLPLARKLVQESTRVASRWIPRKAADRDSRWRLANPEPRGDARAHIWFTGENVRPPVGPWDGYLSFDIEPLGGLNAYLPLWMHSAGVLGPAKSTFTSARPSWHEMVEFREPRGARPRFACAFINNPEPMRLHAIRVLSEVGQVDIFGAAVGRPVPDKAATAGEYRFVLCFENDVYPGYVTEKPFEAWATGAVPLWRGLDPAGYLNPGAMINATDFASLEEFAEVVAQVNGDAELWRHLTSKPILSRPPDLEPANDLLRKVLS